MPPARRRATAAATAAALACLLAPTTTSASEAVAAAPPPADGARTILVACPVASTTEVKPLSVKSLAPLSAAPRTETTFVAWAYEDAPAPRQDTACTPGTEVPFAEGETLPVPGSSGATLTRSATSITVTVGGEAGDLAIAPGSAVTACAAGALYIVRAVPAGGAAAAAELVINGDTRCLAANGVSVSSIPGATSAERTGDPAFAATAGVPLPAGYSPPPPPPPPPAPLAAAVANPCIAPEDGQAVGLTAAFYEDPYPAEGGAKVAAPLDFKGAPAFERCDCPNHKVSNTTWPGTPSLPAGMAANFGAALTGQFLVSRPAGGVAGEGPDLFPTASDYHLVCLQHDGAAALTVDGAVVYEGGLSADAAAGFKQYCAPVMLTPGWHDVAIKYGNSPRLAGAAPSSVLRLFVIDAAQVNSVNIDGVPSYEIVWQGQGRCCTSSAAAAAAAAASGPSCLAPLDCCRFRTSKPCGAGAGPAGPADAPAAVPAPTKAGKPAKKPKATKPAEKEPSAPAAPEASPAGPASVRDAPSPPPPPPTANLNATVPMPVKGCSPAAAALPLKATVRSLAPQTDGRTNVTLDLAIDAAPPAGVTFALAAKAKAGGGGAPVDLACTADGPAAAVCTGAVTLADPFDCLTTPLAIEAIVEAVDGSGKRCPAGPATAAADACQQPQCQLYAVDMGYCGSEGLVTDREAATLVLACTNPVAACGDCFAVTGPPGGGRVAAFTAAPGSNSSYTLTVTWDAAYRGPVTVAVEPARAANECELRLDTAACGFEAPAPVDALTFEVKDDVPVKAAAYKILAGCGAGGCPSASV